jgi:hypothetical protein
MKNAAYLSDERLVRRAVEVLVDELGPAETVRFLSIRRTRRLDVVARHRRWQQTVDPAAFLTELFGAPR